VEQIARDIWSREIVAYGFPTRSVVVFTAMRVFVVDTLTGPQEMAPVVGSLDQRRGDRRVVVVNTHHHHDHVYGNSAFAGTDIVAQRACPRLMTAQSVSGSETVPLAPPGGVPLPTITFGDRLSYADESETVHLLHAPGHSEDSLVVYLENARLLLGGDTVEWPLPNLSQHGGLDAWVDTLRHLKQLPAERIVPSHGPIMGKGIIDANERYLTGISEAVTAAKASGVGRAEVDVPADGFLAGGVELDDTYRRAHLANLLFIWDEV